MTRRIVRLALRAPAEDFRCPSGFLPDEPLPPHCRQIRASRGLPTHEGVWGGSPNKLFPQRRRGFFLQPGGQVDDDQVHAGGTVFGIQQGYPVFAGQGRAIQGIAGLLLHP